MDKKLYTYDFRQVTVIFNGQILSGFAESDSISVEQDNEEYNLQVGADGEATRSRVNNNSATVTLKLMQGSAGNDILNGAVQADRASGAGKGALLIKDGSGRSLHTAAEAWVQKVPTQAFGNEAGERDWVLRTHNLISVYGGN